MPRVKVRPDTEKELRILRALKALDDDPNLSIRAAGRLHGVPRSTLADRHAGKTKSSRESHIHQQLLTEEEEKSVEDWIKRLDDMGIPPKLAHFHEMTASILQQREIAGCSSGQEEHIGGHWITRFLDRHPDIAFRLSARIDNERAAAGNPDSINSFFNRLSEVKSRFQIIPDNTYNADEKGFAIGQATHAKALVRKIRRTSRTRQPGNREWVSVFETVSARGKVLPAFIIYKGKAHLVGNHDYDVRDEATFATSDNGWTDDRLGFLWLSTHFDPLTTPSTCSSGHRLLIFDGHTSHLSLEFVEYCLNHDIHLLCLPSHSTHLLQPLDVGLFAPLKQYFSNFLDNWTRTHPHQQINKGDFFPLLMKARKLAFTEKNIRSAFAATGIVPFRRHAVLDILQHFSATSKPITPPTNAKEVERLKRAAGNSTDVRELKQICGLLATTAGTALTDKAIAQETVHQLATAQKKSHPDRRQISKSRVLNRKDLDRLRKERIKKDEKKKVRKAEKRSTKVFSKSTKGNKRPCYVDEDLPVAKWSKRSKGTTNRPTKSALGRTSKKALPVSN